MKSDVRRIRRRYAGERSEFKQPPSQGRGVLRGIEMRDHLQRRQASAGGIRVTLRSFRQHKLGSDQTNRSGASRHHARVMARSVPLLEDDHRRRRARQPDGLRAGTGDLSVSNRPRDPRRGFRPSHARRRVRTDRTPTGYAPPLDSTRMLSVPFDPGRPGCPHESQSFGVPC